MIETIRLVEIQLLGHQTIGALARLQPQIRLFTGYSLLGHVVCVCVSVRPVIIVLIVALQTFPIARLTSNIFESSARRR